MTQDGSRSDLGSVTRMRNISQDATRRFKHLHDLRRRIFIEADYQSFLLDVPTPCYGCSRMFAVDEDSALTSGYVTTAEYKRTSEGWPYQARFRGKEVHWICSACFHEFQPRFAFELNREMTLRDVLEGPALGPAIGT